jgi:hypothetical protein
MSSNRFKNSGLNTRFDSSRILSRIASYDPWPTAQCRLAFDQLVAHVRCHDDNRVSEIDLLAKAIALFQNLEQQMHDIGMSLFDLIEQDNGVRAASTSPKPRSALSLISSAKSDAEPVEKRP